MTENKDAPSAHAEEVARLKEATEILRKIVKAHDAWISTKGTLYLTSPTGDSGLREAVEFLSALAAGAKEESRG